MLTATNRSNIKISKEIELKKFSEKTSRFVKKDDGKIVLSFISVFFVKLDE